MPDIKELQSVLKKQRDALDELDAQIKSVLSSDMVCENEALKKEAERLGGEVRELNKKLAEFSGENMRLKNALHDQIYSERLGIIQKAMDKESVYFKNILNAEENRLESIERDIKSKLKDMEERLKAYRAENFEELYKKLYNLSCEVSEAAYKAALNAKKEEEDLSAYSMEKFEQLKEEEIPGGVYEEIGQKSNFEAFIGGNLINKLGIFFVIIGVIALSRYTFVRLPDTFKGIVMFAISAGLLALGEFLNRKKPNVFSIGITGGGVACMFLSLALSYFLLGILSPYTAVFLCVLISAGAFVLSRRYGSATVATFALIGGYLPITALSEGNTALIYGAMAYFVVLNLFALGTSTLNKWNVPMFIGFFLNLFGSIYLVAEVIYRNLPYKTVASVAYVLFAFAVYTAMPIIGNLKRKLAFSASDVVLMGMNTFFSSLMMYGVFIACSLNGYMGLLAVIFAAIYILLGFLFEKYASGERRMAVLFYLTGLTFVVLVVPLQGGIKWLAIGWLVQGVLLALYGILTEDPKFRNSGFVIYGLCIFAFLFFDLSLGGELFFFKYMGITLGSLLFLAALCYKGYFGSLFSFFKILTLLNFWWYSAYLIVRLGAKITAGPGSPPLNIEYLTIASIITVTLLLSFAYPAIPYVKDKSVKVLSVIMSIIALFYFWVLNGTERIANYAVYDIPAGVGIMAAMVLIIICVLAIFALRKALLFFIVESRSTVELMPLSVSVYFMIVLTQSLVAQYGVSLTNAVISVIFIVASVAWVVYGFAQKYAFMRRFGLGLSLIAVAKLFLVDLSYLTQGFKIASYFAFGAALLSISFIYQYFSRRLLSGGEEEVDEGYEEK